MPIAAIILVETSGPGNLGAAFRVAANFGVPRVHLVRPGVTADHHDVLKWSCGAHRFLDITIHETFHEAAAPYSTTVGTASARGRSNLPVIGPQRLCLELGRRKAADTALVFGNETRGLSREDLDRCSLIARIPTDPSFPVLNLTQSIAILLGHLAIELAPSLEAPEGLARHEAVEALMHHMEEALLQIGFLDPVNPARILRKLRRILGRAAITEEEVTILHGICRQTLWAAEHNGLRDPRED